MSKLFGLNKPNTNLRKNVFDLSEKNLFSSSVGLLTPILCRELNPGEKVQVSVNALTRSMPLNTAAFVRSRQYFHYFFVPFRQLWSGWDNFINSVDYKTSSFQKDAIYSRIPGIDLFKSIADLIEDGYLTPAFNPATKTIDVPEDNTIRDNTTSYNFGYRGKGRSGFGNIGKVLSRSEIEKEASNQAKPKVAKNIYELFEGGNYTYNRALYTFTNMSFDPSGGHVIFVDGYNAIDADSDLYVYNYGVRRNLKLSTLSKQNEFFYVLTDYKSNDYDGSHGISLEEYVNTTKEINGTHKEVLSTNNADFPQYGISDAYLAKLLGIAYIPANSTAEEIKTAYDAFRGIVNTSPSVTNSTIPASSGKAISFATDAVNKTLDEQGYSYVTGISRLLDMLEYGFSYVEFDEETQSYTQKASTLVDLIDSLSKKKINVLEWLRSEKNKCVVNPFRLLAYQKIYSDFYKRDDYEATNPLHWNIDDFKRGSAVMDFDDNSRLLNMLRLRYRWHNKDYFTGVVPSELLGGLQGFNANSLGMFGDNMQIASDDNKVSVSSGNVSTKGIRAMFALEKLMRLTRRAGGFDYISQTLAHYGFEPPRGRGDKVEFVGGTASNINISEVLSTADTSKGFTGQIYGRGIGSTDEHGDTEFTAKEHGILMCISSIVPDSDYSAEGLNSFNSKLQRGDYFQPEFQDLGLQPVFNYELYNRIYSDNMPENLRINKGVLGFSPRYAEYKSAFDKLHGEFRNGRTLSAWSSVSNVTDTNQGVARNSLKINPGVFNRIFASEYNGHESTDQFLTSAQFECKIIRPMSVTGQNL